MRKRLGLIANSSINHVRAVAYASQMLNIPAMVVLPNEALASEIAAVRECGVEIIVDEAEKRSKVRVTELIDKFGWTLIPSTGSQDVIAGHGSAVKELIEEVGSLDYLFVPVQEGGLLYGAAVALAHLSPACAIIGASRPGDSPLPAYAELARKIVTITDSRAYEQMRFFWEKGGFVVERAGCLGAAALLARVVDVAGARVGVILSGGNVDASVFRRTVLSIRGI